MKTCCAEIGSKRKLFSAKFVFQYTNIGALAFALCFQGKTEWGCKGSHSTTRV